MLAGASAEAQAMQPPGGPRANLLATVESFAPRHAAALHLTGIRVCLEARAAWHPPRHATYGAHKAPSRLPTADSLAQGTPRHWPEQDVFQRLHARYGATTTMTACAGTLARTLAFFVGPWTVQANGSIGGEGSGAAPPGSSFPGSSQAKGADRLGPTGMGPGGDAPVSSPTDVAPPANRQSLPRPVVVRVRNVVSPSPSHQGK